LSNPNSYWKSSEFTTNNNRHVMPKTPLPVGIAEGPRPTQILLGVAFDHAPYFLGAVRRGLGIGHPAFEGLEQIVA
jgi:hypothetical protein